MYTRLLMLGLLLCTLIIVWQTIPHNSLAISERRSESSDVHDHSPRDVESGARPTGALRTPTPQSVWIGSIQASGRVLDATSMTPIYGATVVAHIRPASDSLIDVIPAGLSRHVAKTDHKGAFVLDHLPERVGIDVKVSANGYATKVRRHVKLRSSHLRMLDITLSPTLEVRVSVRDQSGNPIPHARVGALWVTSDGVGSKVIKEGVVHTDNDGLAVLSDVPWLPYQVFAFAEGEYTGQERTVPCCPIVTYPCAIEARGDRSRGSKGKNLFF